jgi:hypothetical protein
MRADTHLSNIVFVVVVDVVVAVVSVDVIIAVLVIVAVAVRHPPDTNITRQLICVVLFINAPLLLCTSYTYDLAQQW